MLVAIPGSNGVTAELATTGPAEFLVSRSRARRWKEQFIENLLFLSAFLSVATTVAIIVVLASGALSFLEDVSLLEFLFGRRWAPLLEPRSFGVLPLLCGSFLIVVGSAVTALPTGLFIGIFLSEYASERARSLIKPALEILAGIPTVVYGYFALTFVTPSLRALLPSTDIFNAASASIAVGIMILPMVASLCDDAMRAVPRSYREAGYSVGAVKFEVAAGVVVPAALGGIAASFLLAVSRAVGESMAVTLAAGATPKLTLNPLESIQTMTAYIVQVSLGDTPVGSVEYKTIFAVGALLFGITLAMNVLSHRVLRRLERRYK